MDGWMDGWMEEELHAASGWQADTREAEIAGVTVLSIIRDNCRIRNL
jgi:hypothetical protein